MVRMIFIHNLLQCFLEITLQRAADAAAVDFGDFNAGFLQETAVNSDFTEFIFNQDHFLSCEYIFNQFLNQGCFTGPKKTGYYINLCHKIHLLSNSIII